MVVVVGAALLDGGLEGGDAVSGGDDEAVSGDAGAVSGDAGAVSLVGASGGVGTGPGRGPV